MGLITKWKSFSTLFIVWSSIASAVTDSTPRMPVMHNVGVIPVYWDETAAELPVKGEIDRRFSSAVRASKRFHVAADDLVNGLWQTTKGRTELKQQYELDGLLSLSVTQRGDVVEVSERLMDMGMSTLLLEVETMTVDQVSHLSAEKIQDLLEQITFRMLNRLPVDMTVTSLTGAYITLSAGSEQGVKIGDGFELVKPQVTGIHPANGSWLTFRKTPVGRVKVVETKTEAAVAKIIRATHDDAIGIGDGARIAAIAGRAKFYASNAGAVVAAAVDEPVMPEVIEVNTPIAAESVTQTNDAAPAATSVQAAPAATASEAPAPKTDAGKSSQGPTFWEDVKGESQKHALADQITFNIGPSLWSFDGSGIPTAKAKFPLWLFNTVGVGAERTFLYKIRGSAMANLLLGSTSASTYFGYDFSARLYWEDDLNITDGFLKGWRGGIVGQLTGLSVSSGEFGGGDWWRGGIFGGLFGTVRFGDQNDRYDWFSHLGFMPMNIGRIGYSGSMRSVESSSGISWELGAYQYQAASLLQWGGAFEYIDERQTLGNGRRPHYSAINLKVLAKYRL